MIAYALDIILNGCDLFCRLRLDNITHICCTFYPTNIVIIMFVKPNKATLETLYMKICK